MRPRPAALALGLLLAGCLRNVPVPAVSAPGDAAALARGRYLATALCACDACHSPRDWTRPAGPQDPSRAFHGGDNAGPRDGLGAGAVLHAPNLTPTRLGPWSDGELVRAITAGMGRGNHPLFPSMPYREYQALALDDALALVAFLRTLPPAPDATPERVLPFPLGLVVNGIPRPVTLRPQAPAPGSPEYGEYLTRSAGCVWCHSEVDGFGRVKAGGELSGGHAFPVPAPGSGTVVSANLTPDPETGLGTWTREAFLARFRQADAAAPLAPGAPNSVMPWASYRALTDQDLGAIHAFLQGLPARRRPVVKYLP